MGNMNLPMPVERNLPIPYERNLPVPIKPKGSFTSMKTIAVTIGCMIVAIALIVLLLSPAGSKCFGYVRDSAPFVTVLVDAMSVLLPTEFLNEAIVATVRSDLSAPEFALWSVMLDMAKVGFTATLSALFLMLFSKLFMNGIGFSNGIMGLFTGPSGSPLERFNFKKMTRIPLYIINSIFLTGYSALLGSLISNISLYLLQKKMETWTEAQANWMSLCVLLAAAVIYVVKDYIGKHKTGGTLRISLLRLLVCKGLPETLNTLLKASFAILFAASCRLYGVHYLTLLAGCIYLLWAVVAKMIDWLMETFVEIIGKMPYLGQRSYLISDVFWLIASVSTIFLSYCMFGTNYSEAGDVLLENIKNMPFLTQFMIDMPMDGFMRNFPVDFAEALAKLFIICIVISLMQYISSSFIATLITQVFLRFFFSVGFFMVAIAVTNAILAVGWPILWARVENIQAVFFLIVMFVLLILVLLQPKVMIQAGLASVLVIVGLHFIPYRYMTLGHDASDELMMHFIMMVVFLDAIAALAAFIQNLFNAFLKKKLV